MSYPPYKQLAQYYDEFFRDHVAVYRRARRTIIGPLISRVRPACDLACGTGTTAIDLARRGMKVFAVDLSPTMCRLTRAKAQRLGTPISVLRADMRTFRLPEPVDLIACEFDAVNHVQRKSDLARVARSVARALRPGGYFYFDVNNRVHLEKNWPSVWWAERPGVVMVMRGSYDRRRAKAREDIEWFVREGARWRRFREQVEEVWWTPAEIRSALRAAGFARINSWDASVFSGGDRRLGPGYRTFYLTRKL